MRPVGWWARTKQVVCELGLEVKAPEDKTWLNRKELSGYLRSGLNKDVDSGKHRSSQKFGLTCLFPLAWPG